MFTIPGSWPDHFLLVSSHGLLSKYCQGREDWFLFDLKIHIKIYNNCLRIVITFALSIFVFSNIQINALIIPKSSSQTSFHNWKTCEQDEKKHPCVHVGTCPASIFLWNLIKVTHKYGENLPTTAAPKISLGETTASFHKDLKD